MSENVDRPVRGPAMNAADRARIALDGLSVGDSFGERFFGSPAIIVQRIRARELPPPPWTWTDDTHMASSLVEVLVESGRVDQDVLASRFATRLSLERGYGAGAVQILSHIGAGMPWRRAAGQAFGGKGSFGNGGAMRV